MTCVPVRCTEQKAAYPVCPAHPFGCGGRSTYRPRPRAIYICCACVFPSIPPLSCSHLQSVFAPVSSYCSSIYSMWKGLPSPIDPPHLLPCRYFNAFASLNVAIVPVSTYIGAIILTSCIDTCKLFRMNCRVY